jgi:hypothetical protein
VKVPRCPDCGGRKDERFGWSHSAWCPRVRRLQVDNANRTMDAYAKGVVCEPVHTSFDRVLPGMPPAVKLTIP